MPHKEQLQFIQLHPTFAAEVVGVDFSKPVPDDVFDEIKAAIAKYGVLVFRNTSLDDASHVAFAERFGELEDASPFVTPDKPHRLSSLYLFDISNLGADGRVAPLTSRDHALARGNAQFHVDSSFQPRRAGLSLLRAARLPPAGTGGETEFADTRAAFDDLPAVRREELARAGYVGAHSLVHSRKTAAPELLAGLDPADYPVSRHRLVQLHEPSGRWNLYIASHLHHIEGLPEAESDRLRDMLYSHATQRKYVVSVDWKNDGDLVVWDNTCVMHRATIGDYEGKYVRDMRRATVHDTSTEAWGLNERSGARQGYPQDPASRS